jgi:hypothetical protein
MMGTSAPFDRHLFQEKWQKFQQSSLVEPLYFANRITRGIIMPIRILVAGVVGGIAMFIWSAAAHMSPLGMIGIQHLPREIFVVETLAAGAGQAGGLYLFPSEGAAAGPDYGSGLLVYHPANIFTMMVPQIAAELSKEILQAILLAYILVHIAGGFGRRMRVAAAAGAMAAITTNGSYQIWYGMPLDYTLTAMAMEFVGYLIAGTVVAWVLGRTEAREGVPARA